MRSEEPKSFAKDTLATIIEAIDANMAGEVAAFGRYLPEGEFHEDEEAQWRLTSHPSSLYNGIALARFEMGDIDAKIERLLKPFKERGLPVSWSVGPATRPANLGTYLQAHGLRVVHASTGMAVDLHALNEEHEASPGLRVEVVDDLEMLRHYARVSMRGFDASPEDNDIYFRTYAAIGFGADLPWRHFIGWLDDQAVAVSSLLLHAGVAGVYGVATVPEARRQGIGAALTLAPLREARARGYHIGVLSPSDMGLRLYQSIGFQEYCKVDIYATG